MEKLMKRDEISNGEAEAVTSKELAMREATVRMKKHAVKLANSRIKDQSTFGDKFFAAYWEVQHLIQKEHKDILSRDYGLELEPWEFVTDEEFDELLAIEAEIAQKLAPSHEQRVNIEVYSVNRRFNKVKWISEKDFV